MLDIILHAENSVSFQKIITTRSKKKKCVFKMKTKNVRIINVKENVHFIRRSDEKKCKVLEYLKINI